MKSKFLTLLLSLIISFGLWLYVVTVISPESEATYYNVPVELVGTEYLDAHDLIIVSDTKGLKMNLTLKGKRSDLSKITSANITILADLSVISNPGEHQIKCVVSFQSGSAEVQNKEPESISVTVAQQASKTIDVKPIFTGSVPAGFEADTDAVMLDHQTLTVKGPRDVVDRISHAGINVDLSGKTSMLDNTYPLTLYGIDGQPMLNTQHVTANVTAVRAIVQIYRVKKVPVQFLLNYEGSGLGEGMARVHSQVETVTLIGSEAALAQTEDQLLFTIELSKYIISTTETFVPVLPEGVSCKEEILVYIGMPEMTTIWLNVDKFELNNVPNGLSIKSTGTTQITVWGPAEILARLTSDDVVGVVDCTNVNTESGYAPATFKVRGYEYLLTDAEWSNAFISVHEIEQNGQ